MNPLDIVKLTPLMARTRGSAGVVIGLVDGPVVTQHPDLSNEHLREVPGENRALCTRATSAACLHGTFIAGILSAKRDSAAPAISPDCTLLIRPIFNETAAAADQMPSATPEELAEAVIECTNFGARIINLSLALANPSTKGERALEEAFNKAMTRGAIVVAAAGNQGSVGGSAITRHPWVIPVIACDLAGRPMNGSNLGSSIGKRGLSAPGDGITSLGAEGKPLTLGGTSVAAPFVSGAIALLWSEFPTASAAEIKLAITHPTTPRRLSVVPPLLDAARSYQSLLTANAMRTS